MEQELALVQTIADEVAALRKDVERLAFLVDTMDVPRIPALIQRGQAKFTCRYCKTLHIHGWPGGDTTTHRRAHCQPPTPYTETGYFLVPGDVTP